MRIAEIAPVWFSVPPAGYGGIELVVALLADGLVDAGHDVTLFASGGSRTKAELVSPFEELPDPGLLGNIWFDAHHTLASFLHIVESGRYDVVHDHSGVIGPALAAIRGAPPPVVHTIHGPWTEPAKRYYRLLHHRVHLVAVSRSQRDDYDEVDYAGVVHNGVALDAYPLGAQDGGFLVYLGRANPDKGPALAVEVAKRAGLPLKMMVKRSEPFEREYWENVVAPELTDEIEVYENVPHDVKTDLLGRASAMVFPIRWREPFGLVMVEAMACGTPVLTAPLGAAPELVTDGETGFLRQGIDEMLEALDHLDEIDPKACRKRVEERFSAEVMVSRYLEIFERVSAT